MTTLELNPSNTENAYLKGELKTATDEYLELQRKIRQGRSAQLEIEAAAQRMEAIESQLARHDPLTFAVYEVKRLNAALNEALSRIAALELRHAEGDTAE